MSANSIRSSASPMSGGIEHLSGLPAESQFSAGGQSLIASADYAKFFNFRAGANAPMSDTLEMNSPYQGITDSKQSAQSKVIAEPLDASKSVQELAEQGMFSQVISVSDSSKLYIAMQSQLLQGEPKNEESLFSKDFYKYVGDNLDLSAGGSVKDFDAASNAESALSKDDAAPSLKIRYEAVSGNDASTQVDPDFIVKQDGTIEMLHNPELDLNDPHNASRKEIVVEVERNSGDVGSPSDAQQKALDALAIYLAARIKQDYPETSSEGVHVDDSQGLVSDSAKSAITPTPTADDLLPPTTQDQVQDLNRLGDSGSGSMSPAQANDTFPQTDTPRTPDETDQIAAIKNEVAGFESGKSPEPYYAIADKGDPAQNGSGYGIGRFGFTSDAIINWIDGLSDDDLDAMEELEDKAPPSKNGKPAKGKLPKGTAAKLRKIRSLVHHKNHKADDKLTDKQASDLERDPDVQNFTNLLKTAWSHADKPTKDAIDKSFDPELQEVMAGDLIHKFAVASVDKAGKVDVGEIVLGLHLGHFPSADDQKRAENQDLMKASEQGYPLAVKAAANPDKPVTWDTTSQGQVVGDPNSYFISQFKSQFNPNNRDYKNENCGPTSLAMAIKHFGGTLPGGNPEDPQKLIEKTIKAMGFNGKLTKGTSASDITRGAQLAGLKTDNIKGIEELNQALAENKQVILFGNPSRSFAAKFNRSVYVSPGTGDHWLLIAGRSSDGGYIVDDPLSLTGAVTRSAKQIAEYTNAPANARLRGDGIALWK
ncbi:MAG: hypothetical protein JST89_24260 [Cyanobacteria bacterium SZAS-4]|nr:hypothetical protein [Cyanobacteria bacterium SZAS-4]